VGPVVAGWIRSFVTCLSETMVPPAGDTVAVGNLSAELTGPVQLELARAVEQLPGPLGMAGGSRYELKWDGFRVGAVCQGGAVRLWSRNGKDFTAKFPDIQGALEAQVDVDCVLDGELVVWTGERLDFDALQQRMVNTATTVRKRLATAQPAALMVFDLLAIDGIDVRRMRWTARRARLESLAGDWTPPLQASPATADVAVAREWLQAFKTSGVEGLVVKGASTRYQPGRRDWVKVNSLGMGSARPRRRGCLVPGQAAGVGWVAVRDRCRGPAVVA
jgi:ATP-dependent DNA ligase